MHNPNSSDVENNIENSEAFNKIVLESSLDCLKILDIDGRIQFMNFNGLCQMEIDDFTPLKNEYWWNLWGAENEKLVRDSVAKALTGEAVQFSAFCNTVKGTPKWWDVTISPVLSAKNEVYQLLSVSRDVTEAKEAEKKIRLLNVDLEEKVKIRTEELLAKNIELEKLNIELSMFNNIASHDLQEPLRKIQIFSKIILQTEGLLDETNKNFNRIIESTERMRNLIDSLQRFSVSKNAEIIFEDFDLREIVQEIQDYFQYEINEKKARIESGELHIITGSKVLITQLIINLFENALKYSKADTPPVIRISSSIVSTKDLTISSSQKYDEYHAIKIEDNGIGFESQYKDKIFELFKRLHHKQEFSGTGIGLTICKTVVEKHHGWIEAESTLGLGATFTIYLPKL